MSKFPTVIQCRCILINGGDLDKSCTYLRKKLLTFNCDLSDELPDPEGDAAVPGLAVHQVLQT